MSILFCPTWALPAVLSTVPEEGTKPQVCIVLDFWSFLSLLINSCWVVSDEMPDVLQNAAHLLWNLRFCWCFRNLGGTSLLVSSVWERDCRLGCRDCRDCRLRTSSVCFRILSQMPCVVMEEFPGEPLCVSEFAAHRGQEWRELSHLCKGNWW